jgi:hypothetical protein
VDEVNDVEPTLYERSELKRWFMSRMPYDLRTRAGRKWKREFIAAGFEFPIKIGQCSDCFYKLFFMLRTCCEFLLLTAFFSFDNYYSFLNFIWVMLQM